MPQPHARHPYTRPGLILALAAATLLACNLTSYRPTPVPPTVGAGSFVNPLVRTGLRNATAAQVQVRDASGSFVASGTITDDNLRNLLNALDVSAQAQARDAACPDHVRLTFIKPDAGQVLLSACLKSVVILRGLPGAEAFDVPLYGAASDALSPYLPDELQDLLDF